MEAEKIETKSIVKPGKNLQAFMDQKAEEASKNGVDPEVGTLRALAKARNTGELQKLINSDVKDVSGTSTSGK